MTMMAVMSMQKRFKHASEDKPDQPTIAKDVQ
jgi:hypothetical protein